MEAREGGRRGNEGMGWRSEGKGSDGRERREEELAVVTFWVKAFLQSQVYLGHRNLPLSYGRGQN